MPNVKYLGFDTSNTKNRVSCGVLNVLKFWDILQYALIFGTVRMRMLYVFIIIFIHFSLSSRLKYIIIFTFSHSFSTSSYPLSLSLFFSPLPFCSILFPFMNHELPSISSLPSHKFHHHWSIKSPSPVFFSPFFRSLLTDLWSHTLRDRDCPGSPLITDPLCDEQEL